MGLPPWHEGARESLSEADRLTQDRWGRVRGQLSKHGNRGSVCGWRVKDREGVGDDDRHPGGALQGVSLGLDYMCWFKQGSSPSSGCPVENRPD